MLRRGLAAAPLLSPPLGATYARSSLKEPIAADRVRRVSQATPWRQAGNAGSSANAAARLRVAELRSDGCLRRLARDERRTSGGRWASVGSKKRSTPWLPSVP